jgi:hypothetical protein
MCCARDTLNKLCRGKDWKINSNNNNLRRKCFSAFTEYLRFGNSTLSGNPFSALWSHLYRRIVKNTTVMFSRVSFTWDAKLIHSYRFKEKNKSVIYGWGKKPKRLSLLLDELIVRAPYPYKTTGFFYIEHPVNYVCCLVVLHRK